MLVIILNQTWWPHSPDTCHISGHPHIVVSPNLPHMHLSGFAPRSPQSLLGAPMALMMLHTFNLTETLLDSTGHLPIPHMDTQTSLCSYMEALLL